MRIFLTVIGLVALGLGILGIFLPVLPTTPFLLLAAALFLKSNEGLYEWLMNHPKLGPYIRNFMEHKAMVWITLTYCAVCVAGHWALRALFIVIAIAVSAHILSYKTLK